MGLFKKLQDFWSKKYYYQITSETLKKYCEAEIQFAIDNKLEFCCQYFILDDAKKHRVDIINLDANRSKKKLPLGIKYYCDNKEYNSFDQMLDDSFQHLNGQFQVMVEDNEPEVFVKEATRIEY